MACGCTGRKSTRIPVEFLDAGLELDAFRVGFFADKDDAVVPGLLFEGLLRCGGHFVELHGFFLPWVIAGRWEAKARGTTQQVQCVFIG